MKKLAFVGAGSHADAVRPFIDERTYQLVGFFDDKQISEHEDLPILGRTGDVIKALDNGVVDAVFVTVGDNKKRKEWFELISENHYDALINIIAPTAMILDGESQAVKGRGIFIGHGAFVGTHVTVGDNTIINTYAVVEHHSEIGKHVNLTPKAVVAGFVKLREGVYVGLNAAVIQLVEIAAWSIVGAGATVVGNLLETGTYVGVPAKKIK
ncbi:MAG: NeuD/PglB/VioB family sugar acetyltransferase [Weissella confusa]